MKRTANDVFATIAEQSKGLSENGLIGCTSQMCEQPLYPLTTEQLWQLKQCFIYLRECYVYKSKRSKHAVSSYSLKHLVEDSAETQGSGYYVPNGIAILAGRCVSLSNKKDGGPNVSFPNLQTPSCMSYRFPPSDSNIWKSQEGRRVLSIKIMQMLRLLVPTEIIGLVLQFITRDIMLPEHKPHHDIANEFVMQLQKFGVPATQYESVYLDAQKRQG